MAESTSRLYPRSFRCRLEVIPHMLDPASLQVPATLCDLCAAAEQDCISLRPHPDRPALLDVQNQRGRSLWKLSSVRVGLGAVQKAGLKRKISDCGEFSQSASVPALLSFWERTGSAPRPFNSYRRVVPTDGPFAGRIVKSRAFVLKFGEV